MASTDRRAAIDCSSLAPDSRKSARMRSTRPNTNASGFAGGATVIQEYKRKAKELKR